MKKFLIVAMAIIMFSACAKAQSSSTPPADDSAIYGTVTSISGNELTIETGTLAQTSPDAQISDSISISGADKNTFSKSDNSTALNGEVQARERINLTGEATVNEVNIANSGTGKRGQGAKSTPTSIIKDGKTKTITLPVNTKVYLKLGEQNVETTFANIKSKDILKIVLDADTPLQVDILASEASNE